MSRDDFAVFHERMPPGTAEEEHSHSKARQFFFVLDGEFSITEEGIDARRNDLDEIASTHDSASC